MKGSKNKKECEPRPKNLGSQLFFHDFPRVIVYDALVSDDRYFEKNDDSNYEYSYYGVDDCIFGEYVNPERIEAYISDEAFYEAVKHSYKSIDLTGRRKRDMERFIAKRDKAADWLRLKANGILDF